MNMKVSAFFFSALVLPSNAQDTPLLRGLGRGGGRGGGSGGGGGGRGGGGGGGRGKGGGGGRSGGKNMFSMMMKGNCYWGANESQPLLDRIEEECATNNPCDEVDSSELDNMCTNPSWATMENEDFMIEGCPDGGLTEQEKEELQAKMQAKKEMWMGMSDTERVEYKEQKEALKANNTATTLLCGCCKGTESIVTLVKDKEGAVAKTLGFRKPRDDSDGEGSSNGFGGHGHHGKPGGWSSHGSGMDIESMLEEKCPDFVEQDGCATTEAEVEGPVNCDWFDSVNVKRGRRHKNKLYCGCCRDDVDPTVDPVDPVDPGGE